MTDTATPVPDERVTQAAVEFIQGLANEGKLALVEPDDDEGGDEGPRLLANGWVRFEIGAANGDNPKRFRLRRPFLREIQKLDLAHEAMITELGEKSSKTARQGEQLKAQIATINDDQELSDTQRATKIRKLRQRARAVTRELRDVQADLLIDWWVKVFDTVGVDGTPEDWPAWIMDAKLPNQILEHWRHVPLGRGAG